MSDESPIALAVELIHELDPEREIMLHPDPVAYEDGGLTDAFAWAKGYQGLCMRVLRSGDVRSYVLSPASGPSPLPSDSTTPGSTQSFLEETSQEVADARESLRRLLTQAALDFALQLAFPQAELFHLAHQGKPDEGAASFALYRRTSLVYLSLAGKRTESKVPSRFFMRTCGEASSRVASYASDLPSLLAWVRTHTGG